MELVNSGISAAMGNSSWIRRMFEAGLELKKQYGADAVYDFSLGNPDLPPPPRYKEPGPAQWRAGCGLLASSWFRFPPIYAQ